MTSFEPFEKFAKPFDPSDGGISDEEKLKAASDFTQLVDDFFLANLDVVIVDEGTATAPRVEITSLTPEGRYLAHLEITPWINAEQTKLIQVVESYKAPRSPERTSIYSMKEGESQVTRFDTVIYPRHVTEEEAMNRSASDVELIEALHRLGEEAENTSLESAMGYNNQPVDADEVAKLRALLFR